MSDMKEYHKFLESKLVRLADSGIDVADSVINDKLFPFQKFIVKKALKKGRYAIFANCGLGKTIMQLEWGRHVSEHTEKPVLVLCPLAVSLQTIGEGEKFGIEVKKYSQKEKIEKGIWISNYEQIDNIDCSIFSGIVADESSCLKNFQGKTKQKIIESFFGTPYKLACTATPSPNDPMELCNHAEFLGAMGRNEMLSMYFVHDGGETSKWRLKGHAHQAFYDFIYEWAIMLEKPSDIGFADTGYNLPPLNIVEKKIIAKKKNNGKLFNDIAVSATNFNAELRITKIERLSEAIDIINQSDENFILWIKQNEEGDYLRKQLPGAVEVKGSDSVEYKENNLLGFAQNKFRILLTKPKIAQFGMNFQSCNNQIFAALDFSFESLFQSIRRSYRFGQKKQVNIYIITTDTMENVINSIREKENLFAEMQKAMVKTMNKNIDKEILSECNIVTSHEEVKEKSYHLMRGDSVQLMPTIPDNSVGMSVFSPPFASLYTYSSEIADMGNSKDYDEFLFAFKFIVKELHRVLWNGRNVVVHCMDLPIQKGKEGYIGLRDFSGMIRECFEKEGFIYHSRVTIWKNPVTEMQRTKALGLLHKQTKKDAAMCRVGLPDYLLVFRKPGEHEHPVRLDISVDRWQKYASPVWFDIDYSNTLNKNQAREEHDERHICPLQLDTIERCIALWSNPGDTIFTPFMGIGSEIYKAIEMGRQGIGIELKESYYNVAVKNVKNIELKTRQKKLFV